MKVEGEYCSVWDGGIEVISNVLVDLDLMEIVEFGERWLGGNAAGIEDPDELETLESEYVYIADTDKTYTAAAFDDADWAEDIYGNGIIVYQR